WWSAELLSREGIWGILFEEANVEDQVETLESWSRDLPENLEGAKSIVIELDQGSLGLQVAPVKPDKSAGGPVGCDFTEGLEVLDDFVRYMGEDVSEEKDEPGVVTFISIKGRHISGRMWSVIVGELGQGQFGMPVIL
ncbi:hypothetical protein C0993_002725, partial [Termitomyces sp. T159_Od127]